MIKWNPIAGVHEYDEREYTERVDTQLRELITKLVRRFLEIEQPTVNTLANDATPSVLNGHVFKTGGVVAITDFDDGVVGQEIVILAEHNITITDGAPIVLNGGGNYAMTSGDTLTLRMFNDQIWHEVARSVN